MELFESEELTDQELSEMLAAWTVPVPTGELRARILYATPSRVLIPMQMPYAGRQSRSIGAAVLLQAAAVALLFAASSTQIVQKKIQAVTPIFFPQVYQSKAPALQKAAGGGGGGTHDPKPVSHGESPHFAAKTFVPPALAVPQPKLPVDPTIT